MMLIDLGLLIMGIILLVKFSSIVITNAEKFSSLTKTNQAVIGFIFIAVATSLPELTIGVISSLKGEGILSVGNLMGANVANITLVFSAMAFTGFNMGVVHSRQMTHALISTSFIALLLILSATLNLVFGVFCLCLFYLFSERIMKQGISVGAQSSYPTIEAAKSLMYLIASVLAVVVSANLVTNAAVSLASEMGIAESVVGATILSFGTTLPEFSINVNAIRKRNISLAMGDMVGSIVTNLTFILGVVSILGTVVITPTEILIAALLIAINVIFLALVRTLKFGFREGVFLLSLYVSFMVITLVFLR